jgi:hypothetical protein
VLALFDWVVLSLLLPEFVMVRAPTPAAPDKTPREATPTPTVNMLATCLNLGICYPPMFKELRRVRSCDRPNTVGVRVQGQ